MRRLYDRDRRLEEALGSTWSQSRLFRWTVRIGAVKGTIVAALGIDAVSLTLAILVMLAFHRLSWMGILISGSLPLILVPLHWYPFARFAERLYETEALLRKSVIRYRSILENMNEAYLEVDRDGRLTFFNDSLIRITGHGREELELARVIDFLGPGARTRLLRCAARVGRSGRAHGVFDLPVAGGDDIPRYVDASLAPLLDDENRPAGYRAVLFDVTDKLKVEREKKALEANLQRAQRMESLGILAGGVAHDLNNILSGIVGYPDMLLLDHREDDALSSALRAIKSSGEKAAGVVQDLLTLSRRGVVVTEVVNLNRVVGDYLDSPEFAQLQRSAPLVRLTTTLDPNLLNIEGSGLHLFKTVMNLVLNSFEAIVPPGTVSVTTANRRLDAPLQGYDRIEPGDYVTLTVADSGVGISPEDRERIFEPFYTRKIMGRSGTGLGMAVVWGTVKDHQGHIVLESEVGRGSSITMYFPASRREMPERQSPPQVEHYRGRGESILVVDDIREQTVLISKILERLGYRVHAARSGEEAVEYLRESAADLVVLDMIMDPGMDGLDTYREIRALRPGLPVILTSGFSETDRVREALRLGAGPYVKKPFRLETLARVVHERLRP